uniref:Uncharacterized protein n=1 Tax=viral metagenome TaxID=1070528 RepID=A0A6M3LT00_9ZZZZ
MSRVIGVDEKWYPVEGTQQEIVTRIVLVAGEIGDYAAYIGHGSIDFVASRGDKLSFAHACIHFPGGQLSENKYRL